MKGGIREGRMEACTILIQKGKKKRGVGVERKNECILCKVYTILRKQ